MDAARAAVKRESEAVDLPDRSMFLPRSANELSLNGGCVS